MTFTDSLLQKWKGMISLTCQGSGGNPLLLLFPRVELPPEWSCCRGGTRVRGGAVFLWGAAFSACSSCEGANFESLLCGFLVAGAEVRQSASAQLNVDAGAERLWFFVFMCWARANLWIWKVSKAVVILIFKILQQRTGEFGGNGVSSMPWGMPHNF